MLVYLTFCPKSGGVPLDENFCYLMNYSWNFDRINKISWESFSYFQVWNLKYLPLQKLQFLNTSYNLMDKSHMEKISPFHFSYFLKWHKLKHTLGFSIDRWSWLLTSSTWSAVFISKPFLVYKLHISHVIKVMTSSISPFFLVLSLVQVSTSYCTCKFWFTGWIEVYLKKALRIRD